MRLAPDWQALAVSFAGQFGHDQNLRTELYGNTVADLGRQR